MAVPSIPPAKLPSAKGAAAPVVFVIKNLAVLLATVHMDKTAACGAWATPLLDI